MLTPKKSRMLFFETRKQRKEVLESILTAQGFGNQLEQYAISHKIGEGCSNPVVIGQHKLTGTKVAIKAIDVQKYARLQKEDRIAEADAMELCADSEHIVSLIEKFAMAGQVYIVTKFASGGDLLHYCL